MKKVLFVCSGNICRSPTAEGVFRYVVQGRGLADKLGHDSCGMHGYHAGEAPDPRAVSAALERGYDLSDLRARRIRDSDFDDFDLLLAMDKSHLSDMELTKPPGCRGEIKLFLDFAPQASFREVPDPYYGGDDGFDLVLDLIESGVDGLVRELESQL